MPKNKIHPAFMHGQPYDHEAEAYADHAEPIEHDDDDEEELDEADPKPKPTAEEERWARMEAELGALKQQNADLRRMIPPPAPPRPNEGEEEEVDWDELIFSNPKEAMRLHGDQIRKSVTRELRAEYQRDTGTRDFWSDFNRANPDLKAERDLVELTMNANMAQLANLPVSDAIEKLADLTRQRISRYSGTRARRGRAVAEGGASSGRGTPSVDRRPERPATLSDVLRKRRAARQGKQVSA